MVAIRNQKLEILPHLNCKLVQTSLILIFFVMALCSLMATNLLYSSTIDVSATSIAPSTTMKTYCYNNEYKDAMRYVT